MTSDNIHIISRLEDVAALYNAASIVVNLSDKKRFIETFGLTALEAFRSSYRPWAVSQKWLKTDTTDSGQMSANWTRLPTTLTLCFQTRISTRTYLQTL